MKTKIAAIFPLTFFVLVVLGIRQDVDAFVHESSAPAEILAPVGISENGKYLVDAQGEPFFWIADTAWGINQRFLREEISTYLDDRQEKGFTVVHFRIPHQERDDKPTLPNQYGLFPFINKDISRPNEEYFKLVDYTLTEMEKRGMVAALLPLWGFVVGGKYGYNVSEQDIIYYARWISERYKERKNIVWVTGGDSGSDDRWVTLGRELKAPDPQKLVTFHPGRRKISSYHLYGDADWLDFHTTQSGHSINLPDNYLTVNEVYNDSSRPIINTEPIYEDMHRKRNNGTIYVVPPHQIRKSAYWSLLAGGFGHVYGHADVTRLNVDRLRSLDSPGALQMSYLISLLRSVPWHTFRPMQNLIASANPIGGAHIRAAASADNRIAFVYFPEHQSAKIELADLEGPLRARWFNPQTGNSENMGTYQANGSIKVTPPFSPDALLILEPANGVPPTDTAEPAPPSVTPTDTATIDPAITNTPTATIEASTPSPTATSVQNSSCVPQSGELLKNGDFEVGTEDWRFSTGGRGSFGTGSPAYTCDLAGRVYIKETGKNMQFYQYGVSLKAGTTYRLSFFAYATAGSDLTAELLKHSSPYTNYGLVQQFDLGEGWQQYSVEFTANGFEGTIHDGRFRFRLHGKNNETYWFDAVSLVEAGSGPATATPTATNTATATHAPTASAEVPTATATSTATPDATASPTSPATSTATPASTPTPTNTHTPNAPTATATQSAEPSCLPQPGELLHNGHFEQGTTDWRFHTDGRGSFVTSAPAYSCDLAARIQIKERDRIMQFYQYGVPLKANTRYRLTFAAYSASGNDLAAELLKHSSPYTNYGLVQQFDLSTGWQTYNVEFTTSGFSGIVDNGRLRFRVYGKNNDTYWLDAVSLQEIDATTSAHDLQNVLSGWQDFFVR